MDFSLPINHRITVRLGMKRASLLDCCDKSEDNFRRLYDETWSEASNPAQVPGSPFKVFVRPVQLDIIQSSYGPQDVASPSTTDSAGEVGVGPRHRRNQVAGSAAAARDARAPLTIAELVGRLHEHDGQLAEQLTQVLVDKDEMLADKDELLRSAKAEAADARAAAAAAEAKLAQRVG